MQNNEINKNVKKIASLWQSRIQIKTCETLIISNFTSCKPHPFLLIEVHHNPYSQSGMSVCVCVGGELIYIRQGICSVRVCDK